MHALSSGAELLRGGGLKAIGVPEIVSVAAHDGVEFGGTFVCTDDICNAAGDDEIQAVS